MTITFLGFIFIPLTVLCILTGRRAWMPWLLSASMPFVQAPALSIAGNMVPPFFVVAVAAVLFVAFTPRSKAVNKLAALAAVLVVFFTLTAFALPTLFEGMPVLIPNGGIDEQVARPGLLEFTLSNAAQAGYVLLAVGVVLFIAENRPKHLHFLNLGFIIGTGLNTWALIADRTGISFPYEIIRATSEGTVFESFYGESERLRGIFAEPSYLATFAISALIFNLFLYSKTSSWRRALVALMVGLNLLSVYFSYSGTAVAGLLTTLFLISAVYTALFVTGRTKLPLVAAAGGTLVGCVVVLLTPTAYAYVSSLVSGKVGSYSYNNRSASNDFSWNLLIDTYGLGVGLGSSRPSSFFFALLSTVGVVGTVIFFAFVWKIAKRAYDTRLFTPEIWCLVATLICKVIAEPNTSNPIMWMALAACAASFTIPASETIKPKKITQSYRPSALSR